MPRREELLFMRGVLFAALLVAPFWLLVLWLVTR